MSRLLDPTLVIVVCLAILFGGWWLTLRYPDARWVRRWRLQLVFPLLMGAAIAAFWIVSTPYFSYRFVAWIEPSPPDLKTLLQPDTAETRVLVVLGGDMNGTSRRYPPLERLGQHTFRRTMHGVLLYREFGARHVIVSGSHGRPRPADMAEAMRQFLVMGGVPNERVIVEAESLNTRENARRVKAVLDTLEYREVVLITSAYHMARAKAEFEAVGLNPIAAPTDYVPYPNQRLLRLVPSSDGLTRTARGVHEVLGRMKP